LSSLTVRSVKGAVFEKKAELSVVLTGDGEVRRLNRFYRKKDRTTDVLSFSLLEGPRFKTGREGTVALGDVVISVPQARRQAVSQKNEFRDELALLLIHGILHLFGYDHETNAGEKKMFGLQERLLRKWKK
jgi:rRNA maturation RNase YbeY